jgi:hypothetical protein
MALTAAGSALVAGSVLENTMQTKRVRVLRAFMYNREPTRVASTLELPLPFALEVIAAKKAEAILDKPAATATGPDDDGKPQASAAKAKGDNHAR